MYMTGKYAFLSNYYTCDILYKGILYNSAETAFQLQKYPLEQRKKYCRLYPWEVKPLGRKAPINIEEWDAKKDEIMFEIVKCKFEQYPDLADKLIKITEPIVEHNDWNDTYWGVCNGNGQNKLGQILAEIREILIVEKAINDVLSSSNYPTLPEYINSFMWDLKVYFMKFFPNNLPHFIDYEMNDCKLFLKVQPHSSVQHLKIPLGGVCCD